MDGLRAACGGWRPDPAIAFREVRLVRNAHLRVPVDEAMDKLLVYYTVLSVKIQDIDEEEFEGFPAWQVVWNDLLIITSVMSRFPS